MRVARRGVTLVELLVVVAILCLLAGLLFPMFVSAKGKSHEAVCASGLKQTHMAVALYQQDHGGEQFGDMYRMGLPPEPITSTLKLPIELGNCKGPAKPPEASDPWFGFRYLPAPPGNTDGVWGHSWEEYVSKEHENAMLLYDLNHNVRPVRMGASGLVFGLGIRLNGALVKKKKSGFAILVSWWDDK